MRTMSARHLRAMLRVTATNSNVCTTLYEFCSTRSRHCSEVLAFCLIVSKPDLQLAVMSLTMSWLHCPKRKRPVKSKRRIPLEDNQYQFPAAERGTDFQRWYTCPLRSTPRLKSILIPIYQNDSLRMVFIFRSLFDILDVVLTCLSFILKIIKSFQYYWYRVTDITRYQNVGKFFRSYSELFVSRIFLKRNRSATSVLLRWSNLQTKEGHKHSEFHLGGLDNNNTASTQWSPRAWSFFNNVISFQKHCTLTNTAVGTILQPCPYLLRGDVGLIPVLSGCRRDS